MQIDPADLCASLVQIRTENPPGDTRDAVEYIRDLLDGLGARSIIAGEEPLKANLITSQTDAALLFCGHLDVVPAMDRGWTYPPFRGDREEGFIWGRGSTDMKGGCAAVISALATVIEEGLEPAVNLAFVCDEETGGGGVRHLLNAGLLSPMDCVIAEPTPARNPCIGQKGLCRMTLTFSGEPGHSSLYPARGVSAIMEAMDLIRYLEEVHEQEFEAGEHLDQILDQSAAVLEETFSMKGLSQVLRRVMFNPGRIEGGEKANIVAQQCMLELDLRIPWGCGLDQLVEGIREHARNATMAIQSSAEPSLTPADARVTTTVCRAVSREYSTPAVPIVQWAASDARALRSEGFDVVEYGPGEISTLHAIDERVSVEQLYAASRIYAGIIREYSG